MYTQSRNNTLCNRQSFGSVARLVSLVSVLAGFQSCNSVALAYTTNFAGAGGNSVITGVQSYNPSTGAAVFRETLTVAGGTAKNIRTAIVPASKAAGVAGTLAVGAFEAAVSSDVHKHFGRAAGASSAAEAAEQAALGTLAAMSKFDVTGSGVDIGRRLSQAIDVHRRNKTNGERDYFEIAKREAEAGRMAQAAAAAAAAAASRDFERGGGKYDVRPDGVYDGANGCLLHLYTVKLIGYRGETVVSSRTGSTVQCAGQSYWGRHDTLPTSVTVNGKKVDVVVSGEERGATRWVVSIDNPTPIRSPSALPDVAGTKDPKDWGSDIYDILSKHLAVSTQILQVLLAGHSTSASRPEGVTAANALSDAVQTHGSARKDFVTSAGAVTVENNTSSVDSDKKAESGEKSTDIPPQAQSGACASGGILEQTWFCDTPDDDDIQVDEGQGKVPVSITARSPACFEPLVFEIPELGFRVSYDFAMYCTTLGYLGYIVVAVAGVISFRIINNG